MDNQLYLFLLFWIVDYQKNILYSNRSFVISDKCLLKTMLGLEDLFFGYYKGFYRILVEYSHSL